MTLANDWLGTAWTQAWQVTLLIAAVALLTRLVATNRPQLAFALWLVVLAKCVTPPLWSSPSGAFCWLQPPVVLAEKASEGDEGGCRIKTLQSGTCSSNGLLRPAADSGLQPSLASTRLTSPENGDTPSGSTFAAILAALWIASTAAMLGATAWRWLRFGRLVKTSGHSEDPKFQNILESLSHRLGLRRRVRLIVTEGRAGPAVLGLLRPTVILPEAVTTGKSADEIELILAHELIHVRRGDLWFALLRSTVESLWWFHPLAWWAGRRASREAERCCDEAVLAELSCGPAHYARCLLDVLEVKHQLRSVPAFPGVRAIEVTQGRLERIMKIGEKGYKRTPWWCWAVAVLAAVAVLPGAALCISAGEKPGDQAESSPLSLGEGQGMKAEQGSESPNLQLSQSPIANPSTVGPHPNPLPKGEGTRKHDESVQYTCTYRADDVLAKIQMEQGLNEAESREYLIKRLKAALANTTAPSQDTVPKALLPANAIGAGTSAIGHAHATPDSTSIQWFKDNNLVITANQKGHKQIVETLEQFRKYGACQVMIEVRFATGPADELKKAKLNWTILPSEFPTIAAPNDNSGPSSPTPFDRSFESENGLRPLRTQSVIEKILPMMYAILDEDAGAKVFDVWQANSQTNILQAPRLVVPNGSTGYCSDCAHTPFVVGRKDGQPQIRIVDDGTTLQLRPLVYGQDKLKLVFRAEFSSILSVETTNLSTVSNNGKPDTVQIPEVETLRVEGSVDLPWKNWMLLRGLERKNGAHGPEMIVMLRAEKIKESDLGKAAAGK